MSVTLFGEAVVTSPTECVVVRTTSRTMCRDLIARWHSTLPVAPPGFRYAFVAYATNGEPVACALWGRPVARMEDFAETLELTRLACGPVVPRNFCSWMLGQMRRYIRENAPEITRLISYQDADIHHGTIYKADNWQMVYEHFTKHTWTNRPGRLGTERMHKIKWERKP
jgi:hypothetical protein